MRTGLGAATASAAAVAAVASVLASCGGSSTVGCSMQSQADFPGAFSSRGNLVVGPFALIGGGRYTDPGTVREFGGNKFPLLVKAGHTVTVQLPLSVRGVAALAYGPLPEGETKLRDAYASVTFVACEPSDGPVGSDADGVPITFWSGFVLTRDPMCVPLEIYVDGARSPRRVGLPLGRRCDQD